MGEGNPVYDSGDAALAQRLEQVPFSAYLGLHENETAQLCQWFVPGRHYLESWGDGRGRDGTLSFIQPAIAPLYGAGTLLGCTLLGVAPMSPSAVDWSMSGRAFYSSLGTTLAPLLWPFVIGNLVLGAVGGLVGFIVLKAVLERRRQTAATVDAP